MCTKRIMENHMAQITAKMVQELRGRTGMGMMDCKKALQEADGDMEKAIELLRKKGAKVAEKRADKEAAEGLVSTYVHAGNKIGVLVEINCETDFVASTDDLKQFANDICLQIAAVGPKYLAPEDVDQEYLEKEKQFLKEQLQEQGKPEHMLDQIVQGKVEKIYKDICLLKQPFVKNEDLTVEEVLHELMTKLGEKIVIRRFTRYEVGEELSN